MKNKLVLVLFALLLVSPISAQASIFDDLLGAVKGLQKQVTDLVTMKIDLTGTGKVASTSAPTAGWKTFADESLGFSVQYPNDWSTSTIFSAIPEYKDADAFVRNSRAAFLAKIIRPSSTAITLAVQDSTIFFRPASSDDMIVNPNKYAKLVSTSTKQIGSSTVSYILYSSKTDPNKFGGGSIEKYVFGNGTSSVVAEANYSDETPSGPVKAVFDNMLATFKFTTSVAVGTSTESASTTLASTSTSTEKTATSGTSTATQMAGVKLSR